MRKALLILGFTSALVAVALVAVALGLRWPNSAQAASLPVTAMSIDMDPFNPGESGADCSDAIDNDGDGFINDGCPQVTGVSEASFVGGCSNALDDDGDTVVNDGCPAVGNTISTVAARESCARINENNSLDADEESVDTVQLDVTVEGIPAYDGTDNGMLSFTYRFNYSEANLTVQAADSAGWKISENAGSVPFDASQPVPDTDGNGFWAASVSDTGPLPDILEDGDGVLTRIDLSTDSGAAPAVYPLTLTNNAIIDRQNNALVTTTTNNASVAVGTGCPAAGSGVVFNGDDDLDFNGDGKTDFAVWRPSNGYWFVRNIATVQWGTAGDIPVPGDYNGDGKTDFAVWRPSNGYWFVRGIGNVQWGTAGDIPVPGDYNGDGKTDFAVWRPSNGVWFIRNMGNAQWGMVGDIPVPGDYDGGGRTDLAVWRPFNGVWFAASWRPSTGTSLIANVQWGTAGDRPAPGDYNGDGRADFAVWRPSSGVWFVRNIANVQWGTAGDRPTPGDFNGDGRTDFTVWRPANGYWFARSIATVQWGAMADVPVGAR